MTAKNSIFQPMSIIVIVSFVAGLIGASETPTIQWNEMAQSEILNEKELGKLRLLFEPWQIKQVTWPSIAEINSKSVTVDAKMKASCIGWLQKFMSKDYLPPDLEKNLIGMKNWGLIRKESEQKRLCDVFIIRFKKGHFIIHIQESPSNVVVAVADERLTIKPRTDHRDWVLEILSSVLNFEALKPNPDMEDLHVSETKYDSHSKSRVTWMIGSVTERKGSRRLINGRKACKIGAANVRAETDGKFVIFNIPKRIEGPTYPDPYTERF